MLVNILMQPFGNKKSALITKALWLVQPENRGVIYGIYSG